MTFLKKLIKKLLFLLPRVILVGIFLFTLIVTVLSNFDYFEPYLPPVYLARAKMRSYNDRILVGPYPHLDEMKALKRSGVQTVISLLDTSLPQEKALAEREAENAQHLGVEVYFFPLGYIPVNSEQNRKMRDKIIALVSSNQKKLYIHCYLGRHRANYVAEGLSPIEPPSVQKH
ncbi:hypothetical protein KI811_03905 [Geobacter hydrogenophilus]|uniref:Uncharacterized protein n=1 Tax=Geobacter hydrogenophilus TaxID=40983 RepID=A0A9W6G1L6_9BACT|nr:hypothetical protein [Geobacter hydrogenophilus]MBT0892965.1 hypothetical protein [Geobacter hydrogenophilus]GLI39199.1 hypothetical protein GHYDROH2_27000 [Geobacter hydrogenophilus]